MRREKRGIILMLSLLGLWGGLSLSAASAASGPAIVGPGKGLVKVLDPVGLLSAADAAVPQAPRLKGFAGKRVWVITIDDGSALMPALAKRLPQDAPGVKVKTIAVSEKGNPFFMLKPEDRPDAIIAGTGVCEATTLEAANYARQAEKIGIPAVILFNADILFAYQEAMDKLKVPGVRAYATNLPDPVRPEDPERLARLLIPQLLEGLTRPLGSDRPRIGFTGAEDKALAYFAALRWTGGLRVTLPTEERLAALLKGTSHKPTEVVGVMAPGMRQATVDKVATLAVMAGFTPEQLPLALALADLLCQKRVAEELGHREPPVLQVAVGGQAARSIGVAGPPEANGLGRLARLLLLHLAGVPATALEEKPLWPTVSAPDKAGEDSIALIDAPRGEVWKQSTTAVDRWR